MIGPNPTSHRDFDLDELTFFFQPVFHAAGGIAWFEALVRREANGIVQGPGGFLRTALSPEWIAAFTDLSIDRILATLAGTSEIAVGLNLSPAQLLLPGTVARVCDAEQRARLVVEVTEQPINDPSALARAVYDLRSSDVRVVLDDITTRDAETRLLPSLDLDGVKLDREMIPWLLAADRRATALVRHLRARGWQVTLEGIEEAALVRRLYGIDCVQGFAFGIPGSLPSDCAVDPRDRPAAPSAAGRVGLRLGWDG